MKVLRNRRPVKANFNSRTNVDQGSAQIANNSRQVEIKKNQIKTKNLKGRRISNEFLIVADHSSSDVVQILQGSEYPVHWIEAEEDPLNAITKILKKQTLLGHTIKHLQLFAHGHLGNLVIGREVVDKQQLINTAIQLKKLQIKTLGLWCCGIGVNHDLISILKTISGANIFSTKGRIDKNHTLIKSSNGSVLDLRHFIQPEYIQNWTGSLGWAITAGGTQADNGFGIASHSDNSSVVTGSYRGTATFGDAGDINSAGRSDIYVAKVDGEGNYNWAVSAGSNGGDYGYDISTNSDGSSIVAGKYTYTATFGAAGDLSSVNDSADIFIAKLDGNGNYQWAASAGGSGKESAESVSTLGDGSSIATGYYNGTATFGAAGNLTSAGSKDIFIAKVNSNGIYQWAVSAGSTGSDTGFSVSSLSDGSSIITGDYTNTSSFGAAGNLTSAGSNDIFIAKVNSNGIFQWATTAGGTAADVGYGISTLGDGSSLITGNIRGTATFGAAGDITTAGSRDIFIAKVDSNGAYQWAVSAGGASNDYGKGISALSDGSSIITGYYQGTATFGAAGDLTSNGNQDGFIAKVDSNGLFQWAVSVGGSDSDYGYEVSALSDGSLLVIGNYEGTATFGSTTLTSSGNNEIFIARLNADGTWASATSTSTSSFTSTSTSSSGHSCQNIKSILYGTSFDDILKGNKCDNQIFGKDGADLIYGKEGADLIYGEELDDYIEGNSGIDTIFGGAGNDVIYGGEGADRLVGNQGQDIINGNQQDDVIHGMDGHDVLRGGKENDWINGNVGDDLIHGDLGDDILLGGRNDDWINGNVGDDLIYGHLGNDILLGGKGNDWIDGGSGTNILWGNLGADIFSLKSGVNQIKDFNPFQGDRIELEIGSNYEVVYINGEITLSTHNGSFTFANTTEDGKTLIGVDLTTWIQFA